MSVRPAGQFRLTLHPVLREMLGLTLEFLITLRRRGESFGARNLQLHMTYIIMRTSTGIGTTTAVAPGSLNAAV